MGKDNTPINDEKAEGKLQGQKLVESFRGKSVQKKVTQLHDFLNSREHTGSTFNYLLWEFYPEYLSYLLLNQIDDFINNKKPYRLGQYYVQELNRLLKPDITQPDFELNVPRFEDLKTVEEFTKMLNEFKDEKNEEFFDALDDIDAIDLKDSFNPFIDYSKPHNREFRNRNDMRFSDTYLQALMPKHDYKNYLLYNKLYLFDEKIGNCQKFEPNRDYNQEYRRQLKYPALKSVLDADYSYSEIQDLILSALEQRGYWYLEYNGK
jgi:hypothetical protein